MSFGADMTPEEARARVDRWLASVPSLVEGIARRAAVRIGGRAVGTFMRDAKGEGRRLSSDGGPLRILSGTLARAVGTAVDGARGAVNQITRSGWVVTLLKGVDLAVVPYARAQEKGALFSVLKTRRRVSIPARPYLMPAAEVEAPGIRRDAQRVLVGSLRAAVSGTGAAFGGEALA